MFEKLDVDDFQILFHHFFTLPFYSLFLGTVVSQIVHLPEFLNVTSGHVLIGASIIAVLFLFSYLRSFIVCETFNIMALRTCLKSCPKDAESFTKHFGVPTFMGFCIIASLLSYQLRTSFRTSEVKLIYGASNLICGRLSKIFVELFPDRNDFPADWRDPIVDELFNQDYSAETLTEADVIKLGNLEDRLEILPVYFIDYLKAELED